MELKNIMEVAVERALADVRRHYDFCSCEQCHLDIAALALNKLPPRYVVTGRGDAYGRAELLATQNELDLFSVVLEAVKKVQASPRH